jgi:hypothetical protein
VHFRALAYLKASVTAVFPTAFIHKKPHTTLDGMEKKC